MLLLVKITDVAQGPRETHGGGPLTRYLRFLHPVEGALYAEGNAK
jgi:hypothetical protein